MRLALEIAEKLKRKTSGIQYFKCVPSDRAWHAGINIRGLTWYSVTLIKMAETGELDLESRQITMAFLTLYIDNNTLDLPVPLHLTTHPT